MKYQKDLEMQIHHMDLELLNTSGKQHSQTKSKFKRINNLFCSNLEKSIVNQAVNAIADIIKNWDNEKKHVYVEKIINNLQIVTILYFLQLNIFSYRTWKASSLLKC